MNGRPGRLASGSFLESLPRWVPGDQLRQYSKPQSKSEGGYGYSAGRRAKDSRDMGLGDQDGILPPEGASFVRPLSPSQIMLIASSLTYWSTRFSLPQQSKHTSTFSVDVDTAGYALLRRFIQQQHRLPRPVFVSKKCWCTAYDYEAPQEIRRIRLIILEVIESPGLMVIN